MGDDDRPLCGMPTPSEREGEALRSCAHALLRSCAWCGGAFEGDASLGGGGGTAGGHPHPIRGRASPLSDPAGGSGPRAPTRPSSSEPDPPTLRWVGRLGRARTRDPVAESEPFRSKRCVPWRVDGMACTDRMGFRITAWCAFPYHGLVRRGPHDDMTSFQRTHARDDATLCSLAHSAQRSGVWHFGVEVTQVCMCGRRMRRFVSE